MKTRARPFTLLSGVTAVGVGPVVSGIATPAIFTALLSGLSGDISATVELWASNDPSCRDSQINAAKVLLVTHNLSGTGAGTNKAVVTEPWVVNAPYIFYWAKVTAIAGNSATVSLFGGTQ